METTRIKRQSSLIASFAMTVPSLFDTTLLSVLGIFLDFDTCDSTGGMKHIILNGVTEELTDLKEHVNVKLEGWWVVLKMA